MYVRDGGSPLRWTGPRPMRGDSEKLEYALKTDGVSFRLTFPELVNGRTINAVDR
jgi:hypothetical protein